MNVIQTNRRGFIKAGISGSASLILSLIGFRLSYAQPSTSLNKTLFQQINRAKNPNQLEGLERGHVPMIMAPDTAETGKPFEVEIQVGEKMHEMIPTHYIDWVDLYADEIFLTKIILTPNFTQARFRATLTLNKSSTLRAIEHCNLHGLWEGTKQIKVL